MTEERILLDNLHGKVIGLSALCITIATALPEAEILLQQFKQQLKSMQPPDAQTNSDHYFLGLKEIHDHFESSVNQKNLDLVLLASEGSSHANWGKLNRVKFDI